MLVSTSWPRDVRRSLGLEDYVRHTFVGSLSDTVPEGPGSPHPVSKRCLAEWQRFVGRLVGEGASGIYSDGRQTMAGTDGRSLLDIVSARGPAPYSDV